MPKELDPKRRAELLVLLRQALAELGAPPVVQEAVCVLAVAMAEHPWPPPDVDAPSVTALILQAVGRSERDPIRRAVRQLHFLQAVVCPEAS